MTIELVVSILTLATLIIGFIGVIIMNLQLNNQIRSDVSKLDDKIDLVNANLTARIDSVNSRLDLFYREFFKKDAA